MWKISWILIVRYTTFMPSIAPQLTHCYIILLDIEFDDSTKLLLELLHWKSKGAHPIMISKGFEIFLHYELSSQLCQPLLRSSRVSQAYNVIKYTTARISALRSLEIMLISINVLA